MSKEFTIASITREEIAERVGENVAKSLTDIEMKQIASRLANAFLDNGLFNLRGLVGNIIKDRTYGNPLS